MPTLAVRLAGPLQSWGEGAPLRNRGTLPYPTYAGLIGLARAALGHSRTANPHDVDWLRTMGMAVRIDDPGRTLRDYHTVNPPDQLRYSHLALGKQHLFTVPTGTTTAKGRAKEWKMPGGATPLVTFRTYLTDAQFHWFVSGPLAEVDRLRSAFEQPAWPLSLGRKACVPDYPMVLGVFPTSNPSEAAASLPGIGAKQRALPVHILSGPIPSGSRPVRHQDQPLGSHPADGYVTHTRHTTTVTPTTIVPGRDALFDWAKEHLT